VTREAEGVDDRNDALAIVGVGASAGGLDAFTRLLQRLPPDAGLAYVLVQHLAPDHESLLPELLGRATVIPVVQARDGIRVESNHAYVIPPNVGMTVTDGHLRLATRVKDDGLYLPIDLFLRSLADVHGPAAVAVILSGAGSDGARGVEAIKEVGGIVYAQDTESARFPGMPEAAVATGCVDFVFTPEEIASQLGQLATYLASPARGRESADGRESDDDADLRAILGLLHRRIGVDFSHYRRGTIQRRILRRMLVHRHETRGDYLDFLRRNASELDLLYEELLIGVTSFFRDPDVFEKLRTSALPDLMKSRAPGLPLRAWVAGCSGGEETYSLAIVLLEFLESIGSDVSIQVFGTDLSESAIARARAAVYPAEIAGQVSPERLRRFFVPEPNKGYRIAKSVRDLCVFSRHNVVRDPPFSHLDLISCRNVLIYMEQPLQQRVLPIFHYALETHGLLLLGGAESPGASTELFEPFSKKHRIYRRRASSSRPASLDLERTSLAAILPGRRRPAENVASNPASLSDALDQVVVSRYAGHGVVVDEQFAIVHFRGDTSRFLTHASGNASLDLVRLARAELVTPLRVALSRVAATGQPVRESNIVLRDEARPRHVTIDVFPLPPVSGQNRRFVVLFDDALPVAPAADDRPAARGRTRRRASGDARDVDVLRDELAAAKQHLADVIEQHGATVEELRAAGEEIQSSNEELQSTNEELETTKEEIQSTNEELNTLNEELRHRNHELGELASDLTNVFASTSIPIVIVGHDLRLRRFTPAATRLMRVIPTDTGRPFGDVKLSFSLPNIEQLITAAVETLATTEHVLEDEHGAWWSLTIRPYRTVDRRVDGAVLVFADIDATKRSELRATKTSVADRVALVGAEEARVAALARANEALAVGMADRERAAAERNVLLRKLDSAEEEERRRLSRELHDEVGQRLTAVGLGVQALADAAGHGPEIETRLATLRELVASLGRELHTLALRLRPKALDDFGLEAALSIFAEEWTQQSGIAVDLHARADDERLPPEIESAVYRIVQEAFTNVARHSRATEASVVIERRDGQLHAIVEDDGIGFDAKALLEGRGAAKGLGLLGIRERVALLNGMMELESGDAGTTLFIRIPIQVQPPVASPHRIHGEYFAAEEAQRP
jgi:two-component system, chemotaxis family, CheB/CheR fusion protein